VVSKVYSSSNNKGSVLKHFQIMWKDLASSTDLAWRISMRDFKSQFRQSLLGMLWAFITPLLSTVVWILLQSAGVIQLKNTGIPYAAYVFSGTMIWSIFTESVFAPLQSTQQAKGIMGKINFPKEALLLSGLYKTFGNGLIRIALVIVAFIFLGIYPSIEILFLPFFLIGLISVGFCVGLLLTPFGMLFNDVGRAIPLALQLTMYLSPVIYNIPENPIFSKVMLLNPLTSIIINIRNSMSGLEFVHIDNFMFVQLFAFMLTLLGWRFYRFSIPIIVERSGS
jgi:lipopolysaccharide transport system permease protein